MIRLFHPLLIPIYAFTFYIELERQSYSIELIQVLMIAALAVCSSWLITLLSNDFCGRRQEQSDPLINIQAGILPRLIVAAGHTISYAVLYIMTSKMQSAYNWGAGCVFPIFILPMWLNVFSGKGLSAMFPKMEGRFPANICLAPGAFLGTLSGFTIALGHKNSADTFTLFTISMLITAIVAHHHIAKHNGQLSHILYGYLAGIIPSIIIMFIFA